MTYLGIDPGLGGAIAVLPDQGEIEFFDTPITEVKSGKKIRRQMHAPGIRMILESIMEKQESTIVVVIEKVQPMPSQQDEDDPTAPRRSMGAASAFNFGKGVGIWIGLLAGLELPYIEVHPATWKKRVLADMGKGKDASRVKAMQLFPQTAKSLSRKKDHGRADALMMAFYGRKAELVPAAEPALSLF